MRLPMFFGLGAATTSLVLLMATGLYAQPPATSAPQTRTTTAVQTKPPVKKVSPAMQRQKMPAKKSLNVKRMEDPCAGGEIARGRRPAVMQRQ
jgi:hypothetical protein